MNNTDRPCSHRAYVLLRQMDNEISCHGMLSRKKLMIWDRKWLRDYLRLEKCLNEMTFQLSSECVEPHWRSRGEFSRHWCEGTELGTCLVIWGESGHMAGEEWTRGRLVWFVISVEWWDLEGCNPKFEFYSKGQRKALDSFKQGLWSEVICFGLHLSQLPFLEVASMPALLSLESTCY